MNNFLIEVVVQIQLWKIKYDYQFRIAYFRQKYSFQTKIFGFRQKYSTTHAPIKSFEDSRKNLDRGNIGCGIFADLQEAFGTAEHDILLA